MSNLLNTRSRVAKVSEVQIQGQYTLEPLPLFQIRVFCTEIRRDQREQIIEAEIDVQTNNYGYKVFFKCLTLGAHFLKQGR